MFKIPDFRYFYFELMYRYYMLNKEEIKLNNESKNLNEPILKKSVVILMAVICGACVANLYYMQPLLSDVAASYNISQSLAGLVITVTQIGYATGLFLFVPLGDIKERRSLIIKMLFVVMAALLAVSFSFNYPMLIVASFLVGLITVAPQIIIPFAAHLSKDSERGEIIGILLSGLLIGILLSRTFSGIVGSIVGWRNVYLIASVLMLILLIFVRLMFPKVIPVSKLSYKSLILSVWPLIKKERVVRESAVNGALMFGTFSAFWTTLVFLLETPSYNMGTREAGLFGLVGIAGAMVAPYVGKISDRKSPKFTVGIGILFSSAAYICFLLFGLKLWGLIIGVILLDIGNQTAQVSNQARIQSLGDEVRSRNNMVFMVSYFLGGAAGSFLGGMLWQYFGWSGVCTAGIIALAAALVFHFVVYRPKKS